MRNSNIEIVRFLSMAMIIIGHLIGFGVIYHYHFENFDSTGFALVCLKVITGYGVNLFVFISGYYRIRLSLKSVTKLYFYMVFYQLILCALGRYALATDMGSFAGCFFPFSHARYWFIQSYFMLMLLSPILNAAIKHISWKKVLIPMAILVFYFGLLFGNPIDDSGFGYFNMTFVYLLAGYLSKTDLKSAKFYFLCYIAACVLEGIVIGMHYYFDTKLTDSYNNPLNIASAAFLFMSFAALPIRNNRFINHVAKSVFAMYLIHETKCIGPKLHDYIYYQFQSGGVELAVVCTLILVIIIALVSVCFDQLRIFLQNNLLEKILSKSFCAKKVNS